MNGWFLLPEVFKGVGAQGNWKCMGRANQAEDASTSRLGTPSQQTQLLWHRSAVPFHCIGAVPFLRGLCWSWLLRAHLRAGTDGARAAVRGPAPPSPSSCLGGIEEPLSQSLPRMHDKARCQKGQDWAHSNYGRGILVSLTTRLRILCDLLFTTSNSHSLV